MEQKRGEKKHFVFLPNPFNLWGCDWLWEWAVDKLLDEEQIEMMLSKGQG